MRKAITLIFTFRNAVVLNRKGYIHIESDTCIDDAIATVVRTVQSTYQNIVKIEALGTKFDGRKLPSRIVRIPHEFQTLEIELGELVTRVKVIVINDTETLGEYLLEVVVGTTMKTILKSLPADRPQHMDQKLTVEFINGKSLPENALTARIEIDTKTITLKDVGPIFEFA